MSTQPQTDSPQAAEPGDSAAADQLLRTYGSEVKELPSQSDASHWIEDLWDMYTGSLFSQQAGYIAYRQVVQLCGY